MKVKYTGLSGIRSFTRADFKSVDLDHEGVKFAGPNLNDISRHKGVAEEVEVSQEVADWLIKTQKEDGKAVFQIVSEDEPAVDPEDEVEEEYSFGGPVQ